MPDSQASFEVTVSILEQMIDPVPPVHMRDSLMDVTERFQTDRFDQALSYAVVDDNHQPVGIVSRYQMMELLLNPYSRDLFGKRPIAQFMNDRPLVIDVQDAPSDVIARISREISTPIVEDFILAESGRYRGLGYVPDVLKLVERNLADRNRALAQANREIRDSQAHLIQSEKMAALGQMVAGVAHEINTPLGYVTNNIQMAGELTSQARVLLHAYDQLIAGMRDQSIDEAEVSARLSAIDEHKTAFDTEQDLQELEGLFDDTRYGLEQIREIVLSLRNFARVDRAATDEVSLIENIESALTIAHHHLKHKVEVLRRFEEIPAIRCAPSQINQVLLNLLTNAAQAIEHERGRILIRTYQRDRFVCVSIEDNGKGIAPEHLKRIFEPFFTTKNVGEGTGLGLSISYRIVRDHGGDIRVASKPGVGTRFEVALPVTDAAMSNAHSHAGDDVQHVSTHASDRIGQEVT